MCLDWNERNKLSMNFTVLRNLTDLEIVLKEEPVSERFIDSTFEFPKNSSLLYRISYM